MHNKYFLKNNIGFCSEFAPDISVQKLILEMFEQYLDKKIHLKSKPTQHMSIMKHANKRYPRKRSSSFNLNEAGFNPLGNVRSTELYGSFESLIGNNSSEQRNLNNELVSPANHLFFMKRFEVETNV